MCDMCNAPEHKDKSEAERAIICKAVEKRLRKQAARLAIMKIVKEAANARTR